MAQVFRLADAPGLKDTDPRKCAVLHYSTIVETIDKFTALNNTDYMILDVQGGRHFSARINRSEMMFVVRPGTLYGKPMPIDTTDKDTVRIYHNIHIVGVLRDEIVEHLACSLSELQCSPSYAFTRLANTYDFLVSRRAEMNVETILATVKEKAFASLTSA